MSTVVGTIKRNVAAGLLVTLPAALTAWLVVLLWNAIQHPLYQFLELFARDPRSLTDSWGQRLVQFLLLHGVNLYPLRKLPGLGLLVVFAILYLTGLAARSLAGRSLIDLGERIVARVPLVGTVYAGMKQVLHAILSDTSGAFRRAVLVEYPRRGLWSVAFVTSRVRPRTGGETDPEGGPEKMICFVPTTPNPTSGVLVMVDPAETLPMNLTTEAALKLVISGGIVLPADPGLGTEPSTEPTPQAAAGGETDDGVAGKSR